MKICGLLKLTLLDYPGHTACTIFTSGCNFRCPFCHNSSLVLDEADEIPKDEIFAFIKKRQGLLDGVCISGGEPLMQADIRDFIKNVRDLGYKIKLDTNGSFPEKLISLCDGGLIDYVAMDIKSSPSGYGKAIGIDNYDIKKVDESIKFLLSGSVDYEFRTTAVRGIHTLEDFEKIGKWIHGAKRYFLQNYKDSHNILCNNGLSPFSEEELKNIKKLLNSAVCEVNTRGI